MPPMELRSFENAFCAWSSRTNLRSPVNPVKSRRRYVFSMKAAIFNHMHIFARLQLIELQAPLRVLQIILEAPLRIIGRRTINFPVRINGAKALGDFLRI